MIYLAAAALIACALMLVLMPRFLPFLRKMKFGQTIYELGPKHQQKQGTPNMGGVLIGGATVVASVALSFAQGCFAELAPMLLLALGAMAIGFADDYIKDVKKRHDGLSPKQKIAGQVVIGALFSYYCLRRFGSAVVIPFSGAEWNLGYFYIPLMTLLVMFMTNSANLQDGVDGLLSSVTVVGGAAWGLIAFFIAVAAGTGGSTAEGCLCFALVGACVGFLRFNRHPAMIFMGDTGSMFIGGVMVGVAMTLRLQFLLIPICFTMIMSSVSVIMQRYYYKATHGKRIFKMSPIHHHFELCGMSENAIVRMYSAVTLALSVLAVWAAGCLY